MLTIRTQQLDSLDADVRRRGNERLAEYLQRRFPTVYGAKAVEELVRWIDENRKSAEKFGLILDDQVAAYLDLATMYGSEFHTAAWASPILNNNSLTSESKVERLRDQMARVGVEL